MVSSLVTAVMISYQNPWFLIRLVKSYLADKNRLMHFSAERLRRYQDASLRKMVRYADMVPLYHAKFKDCDVRPSDIRGIGDLEKLPLVTKDDLRNNYPRGIIPVDYREQSGFSIHSSGSTGQPVFVFTDIYSAITSLLGFVRTLEYYGGDWQKSRVSLIIDTSPGSVENMVFTSSAFPFLSRFIKMSNILYLDITEKPEVLVKKLEEFQPEFLGSDPIILRKLSYLRYQGIGEDFSPKHIFSSGTMLDAYTRGYVEQVFDSSIVDVYGTTEAGPLAFQCKSREMYHVHSDFVYLEFLDESNNYVTTETPGRIVVTKLYGGGTPIIRYTGFNDLVTPFFSSTDCSLKTQFIKRIEGRQTDMLVMPDNSYLSPLTVTGIPAKIMQQYGSYKIQQFQIIQRAKNKIQVLIVIDALQRDKGIVVADLLKELKRRFEESIGHGVAIEVLEVASIQDGKPTDNIKVVISEVPQSKLP